MTKRSKCFTDEEKERIPKLSNRELVQEMLDLAGGDDHDGCWTGRGKTTFTLLKQEFENRLGDWLGPGSFTRDEIE